MTPLPGPPLEHEIVDRVLAQVRSNTRTPILLGGAIGSGKTRTAERAVRLLREEGLKVGGVLAPRVMHGEETTGYRIRDLATDSERSLATLRPPGVPVGRYFLSRDGLRFAQRTITAAIRTVDVLVVDEIGRLEIAGDGHAASVRDALDSKVIPILLVRDDFIDDVIQAFSLSSTIVVHVASSTTGAAGRSESPPIPPILWNLVDSIPFPLLVTHRPDGYPHGRAMRVLARDGRTLWFATSSTSDKVRQIERDAHVALLFVDSRRFNYVCLHGTATVADDPDRKTALWDDEWRDDWPDGPSDPDFAIVRVDVVGAHYSRGFTGETGSVDLRDGP